MKRLAVTLLTFFLLAAVFAPAAFAGDPLDENGETGGSGVDGTGDLNGYWDNTWYGMRITVVDVSDPAREIGGEQWGKIAVGTVSVDITNLTSASPFFTRLTAGDGTTALTHGAKTTHFGYLSKMAYRDGAPLALTTAAYNFRTVTGLPKLMGSTQASAQAIKDFVNNQAMLTNIAAWCGGGLTYADLISGQYKILAEPVMYCLIGTYKYAFTPTEAAMLKPYGDTSRTLINNTLANAFYLSHDELGWDAGRARRMSVSHFRL
jgi:hypothetical protein